MAARSGGDPIHVVGKVKKVGNSLAFFIPAEAARRAGLVEGQVITADLRAEAPPIFGILKGRVKGRFSRRDLYDE